MVRTKATRPEAARRAGPARDKQPIAGKWGKSLYCGVVGSAKSRASEGLAVGSGMQKKVEGIVG